MILIALDYILQRYIVYFEQEDSTVTESRPVTAQANTNADPLGLDEDDLYCKYKVGTMWQL